jgi:hypothetical protein
VLRDGGWLLDWNPTAVIEALARRQKVFTGAFMINSPGGEDKLPAIVRRISDVWKRRDNLMLKARNWTRLAESHVDLKGFEGLGGFMAYEIVCDLRYTRFLEHASDKLPWSNPGPGAIRGLMRVLGREIKNKSNATSPPVPKDWELQTRKLLTLLQERFPDMPRFEMREVEHSLCEYDKYVRLLMGEGKAKRSYQGAAQERPPATGDEPSNFGGTHDGPPAGVADYATAGAAAVGKSGGR